MIGLSLGLWNRTKGGGAEPIVPSNNLIMWAGDSRFDQGTAIASPSATVFENNGIQFWGLGLSGGRARMRYADDFSTSGYSTQDVLDGVATMAASGCNTAVILISINDRTAGVDADWTTSRLEQVITGLRDEGIVVLLCNEMPVDFLDGTQTAYHQEVHEWIDTQHDPLNGVYVVDTWGAVESSPGSNTPAAGVYRDEAQDKHPTTKGAYLIGAALAEVISTILPEDETVEPSSDSDPRLLSTNPFMTGTGGTITSSNGGSGQLATGFTYLRASGANGIAVAMSKETLDDGNEWQKYVFSGTPGASAAVDLARQQTLQAGLGVGQYAEAVLKVRFSTDFANIRSVKSGVRMIGAADNWHTAGDETSNAVDVIPAFDSVVEMTIRSPRIQNPGSLTNLVLRPGMYPVASVVAAGTMWIGCCALLKYDTP